MNRIFNVVLSNSYDTPSARWSFEVVEKTAKAAIDKATKRAKRDNSHRSHRYRGGFLVESLTHRGQAV